MKKAVQTPWAERRSYGGRDSWIGSIDFTKDISIWKVLTMLMFLLEFVDFICLNCVFSKLPWQYQKLTSVGKPYIDTENTDFTGVVTDVATDGTYIYCGYGWRYIIKVLDEEGNYIETIALSDAHDPRGNFRLTEQENAVVCWLTPHKYVFACGEMISADLNQNGQPRWHGETTELHGSRYYIHQGAVMKQTPDGEVSTFYATPWYFRLLNRDTDITTIGPLGMCCCIVFTWLSGRTDEKKAEKRRKQKRVA